MWKKIELRNQIFLTKFIFDCASAVTMMVKNGSPLLDNLPLTLLYSITNTAVPFNILKLNLISSSG